MPFQGQLENHSTAMKNLHNKSLDNYIMNFNKYIIIRYWKIDYVQFYRNEENYDYT